MDAWVWIVIVVVAVAVLAVAVFAWQQTRRKRLQETFGPEYDRAVSGSESRKEAEAELEERRKRREELEIRLLPAADVERYRREWEDVQVRFVDDPVGSTRDADKLVQQVMSDRGYPMDDFDARADLISVDHPTVVENYREAHSTYLAFDRGDASTEDLRQAMVHYRSLFDELVSENDNRARTQEEVQ